jgi:hypothetical protein
VTWTYEVTYIDGLVDSYKSPRLVHPQPTDINLIIYINEHGHDQRFDEVLIPLRNVRRYIIKEVR